MGKRTFRIDPRQSHFLDEYLVDLNGTAAAIRAGYAPNSARITACKMLAKPHIAAELRKRQSVRIARSEMRQDDVLAELRKLSFSDIRALFDPEGRLYHVSSLPPEVSACIASIEVVTKTLPQQGGAPVEVEYTHKIKFWDKSAAIALAMRHLGLLNDKLKLAGDADNPVAILLGQVVGTSFQPKPQKG